MTNKKSEKSVVEHEIKELIKTINNSVVIIKDIEEFKSLLGKVQKKIEELRISRDKWREKYRYSQKGSLIQ